MRNSHPQWTRIATALILAIVIGQIAVAAYAIERDDSELEPEVPIIPEVAIAGPLDLEGAAALGLAIAREWRSDAVLVNAGMQVDWPDDMVNRVPTELPRGGWALLRYLSGNDILALRIDRGSGVVVETELQTLTDSDAALLASQAIDFQRASTSSTTAILATEAAYGQRYRAACPERRRATWISVLADGNAGDPAWFVRYRDNGDPERTTLSVRINWATGDIFDGVNTNPTCAD
jgi:hypothetical protein